MTPEEKNTFFENNKRDFSLCYLILYITFNEEMQKSEFSKHLKTLRTNNTFASKGLKKKLLHEEWFSFKHTGKRIFTRPSFVSCWDVDGNLDYYKQKDEIKQPVEKYSIPVLFYCNAKDKHGYFSSFLKMVNDYFSFHMNSWDNLKKTVEIRTRNSVRDNFPDLDVYYIQKNHRKEVEHPILFRINIENSKYCWVLNFIENHAVEGISILDTIRGSMYEDWTTVKLSTKCFNTMKEHCKAESNEVLAEILLKENPITPWTQSIGGVQKFEGYYAFSVECDKNYSYNVDK